MDVANEDDSAMMAMMGLSGFGTTKAWSSYLLLRSDANTALYRENRSKVIRKAQLM
jgi:hypothetical protein